MLHDDTATRGGILESLEALGERLGEGGQPVVLLFGARRVWRGWKLLPGQPRRPLSNRKVVAGSGVSQGELLEKMARIPAKRVLMVFNACHSGEISPTLGQEDDLGSKNLPAAAASALLSTGSGRIIITACREGQYSYIGGGELTLFTQALVDGLRGVDVLSRGGFISAYDLYASMYDTVSEKVQELYKREQQPELTVLKGLGELCCSALSRRNRYPAGCSRERRRAPGWDRRAPGATGESPKAFSAADRGSNRLYPECER